MTSAALTRQQLEELAGQPTRLEWHVTELVFAAVCTMANERPRANLVPYGDGTYSVSRVVSFVRDGITFVCYAPARPFEVNA